MILCKKINIESIVLARAVVGYREVVSECFSRLLNFEFEKNVYVRDMVLGRGGEGGCRSWRRNLFVWGG